MASDFEELDYRRTHLGELVLRRRREPRLGVDVIEVKLGDDFLMSSLFTAGEVALAELGLAWCADEPLDIVVGGLGLGYTAKAVLDSPRVRSLQVVEALEPVIDWHRRGLVPLGAALCSDARCELRPGDFFQRAASDAIDEREPGRKFHGIFVDIDHSPRDLLDPGTAGFYSAGVLELLARHLRPGGVFALWSNDPPDKELAADLGRVFARHEARVVTFPNPLQDREAACTIYRAGLAPAKGAPGRP